MALLMDRATLLETMRAAYDRLGATLAILSDEQMLRVGGGGGEWTVKDVLAHLTWWEHYTLRRFAGAPQLLADGPDDAAILDTTNQRVYEEGRQMSLADAQLAYHEAFRQLYSAIAALPDERIMDEHIQGLIAGNSYDHFDEHLRTIRAWLDHQQRV